MLMAINLSGFVGGNKHNFRGSFLFPATSAQFTIHDGSIDLACHSQPIKLVLHYDVHGPFPR